MQDATIRPVLTGYNALVVGIANDQSIAYGCAKAFRNAGAELAVTWLNDKARPHVEPLARELANASGAAVMLGSASGTFARARSSRQARPSSWSSNAKTGVTFMLSAPTARSPPATCRKVGWRD